MAVALVTGAGSGIGRAVALGLAEAGYAVVLAGRRREPLDEVARQAGRSCRVATVDVRDPASVQQLFAGIRAQEGRLDVLFNNAGVAHPPTPLDEVTLAQWTPVIDTNVTGMFLCAQAAFALMKAQQPRGGRIINNGSLSATVPRPNLVSYTVAKHAVTGLTRALALEGRPWDIACGQIDIGNVHTGLGPPLQQGTLQADQSIRPEPAMDMRAVVDAVRYMAGLPLAANVLSLTVMATGMPYVGRG